MLIFVILIVTYTTQQFGFPLYFTVLHSGSHWPRLAASMHLAGHSSAQHARFPLNLWH